MVHLVETFETGYFSTTQEKANLRASQTSEALLINRPGVAEAVL